MLVEDVVGTGTLSSGKSALVKVLLAFLTLLGSACGDRFFFLALGLVMNTGEQGVMPMSDSSIVVP